MTNTEVTKEIILKMIDKDMILIAAGDKTPEQRAEAYAQEICKAFEKVISTVKKY
jgi:hypothetical protein